jgi:hypothetical protein
MRVPICDSMESVSPRPEEVVGGVVEPHEAAGDTRNSAVHADGVLPALFHLERDIDGVGLRIALQIGSVFLLQHFEIAELVEAQNAVVPHLAVEQSPFVDQDLAADDLVARGGVPGEVDAADEELLAFVGGERQVDLIGIGIRSNEGSGTKSMKPNWP